MILNVAVHMALHSASMSAIRAGSHGGGAISVSEFTAAMITIFYFTYVMMVVIGFLVGEYESKKEFILDLVIPFWGLIRTGIKQFKELE